MTISRANPNPGHAGPQQYRATGDVGAASTARAIEYVRDQWIAAGIDRDTDEEVLAVARG